MKPELRRFGRDQSPVAVIDGFGGAPGEIVQIAAAMAPFAESAATQYPGLRRHITPADADAYAYVERTLEAAAPFLGGAFGFKRFELIEASFSMVTAAPETLRPAQRAPHFDSTDPGYVALLHYLRETPGTAFYRQRATGIETVREDNLDRFVEAARRDSAVMSGYINASDNWFERTGIIEGRADRLALYRGNMLHSGIIPADMDFSSDPYRGRLTANIFIQGY
jgi:hypothetical protein